MHKNSFFHNESGNAKIIGLVLVLAAAIGSFAFFATQNKGSKSSAAAVETAAGSQDSASQAGNANQQADAGASAGEIKPGNPVVAKVDGSDITRLDVLNLIQGLPAQTKQMPVEQLFPLAVEQLVSAKLVEEKTQGINLDNDPDVQKQLEEAKKQIVRTVYLQKEVEKKLTDDKLKEAYDAYVKNFPDVQEVKASHILVKEESKAQDLIKQLDGGADFAQLAKDNSTDGTAKNGGALGYFSEKDVVPAFGKAAFSIEPGAYTKTPVKTDFGYHVIKIEEKRKRPPAEFAQAKPFLEAQLRRLLLDQMVQEWRKQATIETFDINGNKIEPAAGKN